MKYTKTDSRYIVRLARGDKLIENLTDLVKKENIQGAWISGLGGALSAEIGFYHLERQEYEFKVFEQLLEITSLQGNISWIDDLPKLHIHGSFSDENMNMIGGHVKELIVGGTCELLIQALDVGLSRVQNDEVGLPLLDL